MIINTVGGGSGEGGMLLFAARYNSRTDADYTDNLTILANGTYNVTWSGNTKYISSARLFTQNTTLPTSTYVILQNVPNPITFQKIAESLLGNSGSSNYVYRATGQNMIMVPQNPPSTNEITTARQIVGGKLTFNGTTTSNPYIRNSSQIASSSVSISDSTQVIGANAHIVAYVGITFSYLYGDTDGRYKIIYLPKIECDIENNSFTNIRVISDVRIVDDNGDVYENVGWSSGTTSYSFEKLYIESIELL